MTEYEKKKAAADDYCRLKAKQGNFTEHDLFIMKFAFMAGWDKNKTDGSN